MIQMQYKDVRGIIKDGDFFGFGGWALWPSIPLRYWDNGYRWNQLKGWTSLGPYSHCEIACWDVTTPAKQVLCGWGSVGGGVRKMPLSRLLSVYGKFTWAPLLEDSKRNEIILRANDLWRSDDKELARGRYPSWRQYVRTAFRSLYNEKVDFDPIGFTCWEWVASCYDLENPASWWATEILGWCGLGKPITVVV